MKIILLMFMLFLCGCESEIELKDSVSYELGEEISYDLNDYLLSDHKIDDYKISLLENMKGCGKYHIKVEENNRLHYIDLIIEDTTAPLVNISKVIEVYENENIDYDRYYQISDLSNYSIKIHDESVDLSKKGTYKASLEVTDAFFNTTIKEFDIVVKEKKINKQVKKETKKTYYNDIETYVQGDYGYKLACEGVSLYMALKGKGYIKDMDLHTFMETMPYSSESPEYGYMGDPTKSKNAKENLGKRTSIYPNALALWGKQYGNVLSLEGKDVDALKKEIRNGNIVIVYMTSSFKDAIWKEYSFGKAVSNNHALCLVGYDEKTNEYIVNDCGKKGCVYRVKKNVFEKSYRERYFAVVVR